MARRQTGSRSVRGGGISCSSGLATRSSGGRAVSSVRRSLIYGYDPAESREGADYTTPQNQRKEEKRVGCARARQRQLPTLPQSVQLLSQLNYPWKRAGHPCRHWVHRTPNCSLRVSGVDHHCTPLLGAGTCI